MPKRQDEQIGETHYVNLESVSLSDDISVEEVESRVTDVSSTIVESRPITGMDLLRFAKLIIGAAVVVVLVIGFMYIFNENNKAVKDVWSFTSTAANSIIALVIGYYFGTKQV